MKIRVTEVQYSNKVAS